MSRARYRVTAGSPTQLGAVADARGVNFAVFSANATRVDICLFDEDGREESARIPLPEFTDQVWHGHVAGLKPGQLYGLRVHGPYAPAEGHRFNPNKLLIDPYAKGLTGNPEWRDEHFGYVVGSGSDDIVDERDSAPFTPKCVVPAKAPSRWKPRLRFGKKAFAPTAWADTIIYEAHVKGLTQLSEAVPAQSRGTFAALGHPSVVEYLLKLGVTTVELQPVQAFAHDRYLQEKDLRNYWGYSPLNYFAPMTDYLGPGGIDDVSEAVQQLHSAGIEVILDVVYNHTCEGNHLGPTISFRGIDNASYYKLSDDPRFYFDTTGCGNTLNIGTPRVLQLVTDSLRHWVEAYGIDDRLLRSAVDEETVSAMADHAADPSPCLAGGAVDEAATDALTQRLTALARELLPDAEADYSFFDAGGHSLLALRYARMVEDEFSVRLSLVAMARSSLRGLAAELWQAGAGRAGPP